MTLSESNELGLEKEKCRIDCEIVQTELELVSVFISEKIKKHIQKTSFISRNTFRNQFDF